MARSKYGIWRQALGRADLRWLLLEQGPHWRWEMHVARIVASYVRAQANVIGFASK